MVAPQFDVSFIKNPSQKSNEVRAYVHTLAKRAAESEPISRGGAGAGVAFRHDAQRPCAGARCRLREKTGCNRMPELIHKLNELRGCSAIERPGIAVQSAAGTKTFAEQNRRDFVLQRELLHGQDRTRRRCAAHTRTCHLAPASHQKAEQARLRPNHGGMRRVFQSR